MHVSNTRYQVYTSCRVLLWVVDCGATSAVVWTPSVGCITVFTLSTVVDIGVFYRVDSRRNHRRNTGILYCNCCVCNSPENTREGIIGIPNEGLPFLSSGTAVQVHDDQSIQYYCCNAYIPVHTTQQQQRTPPPTTTTAVININGINSTKLQQ